MTDQGKNGSAALMRTVLS